MKNVPREATGHERENRRGRPTGVMKHGTGWGGVGWCTPGPAPHISGGFGMERGSSGESINWGFPTRREEFGLTEGLGKMNCVLPQTLHV